MNLPLKNANRTQNLLTKTLLKGVPALYAQENAKDAICYLKFFLGSFTWYVTEINPETGEAFGKTEGIRKKAMTANTNTVKTTE